MSLNPGHRQLTMVPSQSASRSMMLPVCNTTQYTYQAVSGRQAGCLWCTQCSTKLKQISKPEARKGSPDSQHLSPDSKVMTPVQSRCQGPPSKLHFTFQVAEMNCRIVKSLNLPLPYQQGSVSFFDFKLNQMLFVLGLNLKKQSNLFLV